MQNIFGTKKSIAPTSDTLKLPAYNRVLNLRVMGEQMKERAMTILFNDFEPWFGLDTPGDIVERINGGASRIIEDDKHVIGFKSDSYKSQNGIFIRSHDFNPVILHREYGY